MYIVRVPIPVYAYPYNIPYKTLLEIELLPLQLTKSWNTFLASIICGLSCIVLIFRLVIGVSTLSRYRLNVAIGTFMIHKSKK